MVKYLKFDYGVCGLDIRRRPTFETPSCGLVEVRAED